MVPEAHESITSWRGHMVTRDQAESSQTDLQAQRATGKGFTLKAHTLEGTSSSKAMLLSPPTSGTSWDQVSSA